jgi:hypothetical protein
MSEIDRNHLTNEQDNGLTMVAARAMAAGGTPLMAVGSCSFWCQWELFTMSSSWHKSSMKVSPIFSDDLKNIISSTALSAPTQKNWLGT